MSTIEATTHAVAFHGHTLPVISVQIDGRIVSETFAPFDATTEHITSRICEECYVSSRGGMGSCSLPDITARQYHDTVYWFIADNESAQYFWPKTPLNTLWSFSQAEYDNQLGGSADSLKEFSNDDARLILLRSTVFPHGSGLYTIPDIPDDPQGRRLLKSIGAMIRAESPIICNAPADFASVRIGIESEGIPEVIIDIGKSSGRCAIRFVSHPSLPIWVTSDEIHRLLAPLAITLLDS